MKENVNVKKMADITMCTNQTCPLKTKCYRQTANRNSYRQAVSKFEYKETDKGIECNHYWPINKRTK